MSGGGLASCSSLGCYTCPLRAERLASLRHQRSRPARFKRRPCRLRALAAGLACCLSPQARSKASEGESWARQAGVAAPLSGRLKCTEAVAACSQLLSVTIGCLRREQRPAPGAAPAAAVAAAAAAV